ncbi:TPA: hypothetical protein KD885_002999 [Vibrio parahaemolyticus]|nr:hypothetical protein [Vibrio parahaemolyticus]
MEVLLEQLQVLIVKYEEMQKRSKHNDLSDLSKVERQSLVTRALAAVHRVSGANSTYSKEIERIMLEVPELHRHTSSIIGIVSALHDDLEAGYMNSLIDLVHADIFANLLDMAYHLHESGYKDAAAVITGSTLESHIRELCAKRKIPTVDDKGRPAKADKLNSDLAKAEVYSKLDQKNVTAWLDLRNKAAHGSYEEYTHDQVALLISAIRDFIGRVPA